LKISLSVLLRTRNFSGKRSRGNQNTGFVFNNVFCENCAVCELMWKKYCTVGQGTDDYDACALHAG